VVLVLVLVLVLVRVLVRVVDVVVDVDGLPCGRAAYPTARRARRGSDEAAAAGTEPCAGTGSE
jgi:hypothetical protein